MLPPSKFGAWGLWNVAETSDTDIEAGTWHGRTSTNCHIVSVSVQPVSYNLHRLVFASSMTASCVRVVVGLTPTYTYASYRRFGGSRRSRDFGWLPVGRTRQPGCCRRECLCARQGGSPSPHRPMECEKFYSKVRMGDPYMGRRLGGPTDTLTGYYPPVILGVRGNTGLQEAPTWQ